MENKQRNNLIEDDDDLNENEKNCTKTFKEIFSCFLENEVSPTETEKSELEKIKKPKTKKITSENELFNYFENLDPKKAEKSKEWLKKIEDSMKREIDINYKNEYDDTVLLESCKLENIKIFKKLRELGANLIPNKYGHGVLHIAAYKNNLNLVDYILKNEITDKNRQDIIELKTNEEEQTPLHYAAKKGNLEIVKLLVNSNAFIEAKDHQGRTPLYLACEHGNQKVVEYLIENNAEIDVRNKFGQKALYWLINKCTDLAPDILDRYRMFNKYTKQDTYYLKYVDLEFIINKKDKERIPSAPSILFDIVQNERLELIVHPVISKLIQKKWSEFGRVRAYIDLVVTIITVVVLNIFGCLVPYNERYIYKFPQDWWRVVLLILDILLICVWIFNLGFELYYKSKHFEKCNEHRINELKEDGGRYCIHRYLASQKKFIDKEKLKCKKVNVFYSYLTDSWFWVDITTIALNSASVITHFVDIANHSEKLARDHIRVLSVTICFVSLKLLKSSRVINQQFGELVMTIEFSLYSIGIWVVAFFTVLIPYTSAFWMLYGVPIYNESMNSTITVTDMSTYGDTMFVLYRETFGTDVDRTNMKLIDPTITDFLIALYLGATTLILVNIFIALLTSTFNRVHDRSKAYFLLQRAIETLKIEFSMNYKTHQTHLSSLKQRHIDSRKGTIDDVVDDNYEIIGNKLEDLSEEIEDLNSCIEELEKKLEESDSKQKENTQAFEPKKSKKNQPNDKDEEFTRVFEELKDLKNLINDLLESNDNIDYKGNMILALRNPRVDVLQLNELDERSEGFADISNVKISPKKEDLRNSEA